MDEKFLTKVCPNCFGSGKVFDRQFFGAAMRLERQKNGKSLRAVASLMGCSASFVCDLEHGFRKFSPDWIAKYKEALR